MKVMFLPSPLLGGVSFQPLAVELEERGWQTYIATLPDSPITPERVLDAFIRRTADLRPDILVPHSNAGLFAPPVAARTGNQSIIFMDAALPGAEGSTALVSPRFSEFVSKLPVSDGLLPPWTDWWDADAIAALFPDPVWLQRVTESQPRLSPDYFSGSVDVPPDWIEGSNAYLGFGKTYADELTMATEYGWPTMTLDGLHLHHLWAPDEVASAVEHLCSQVA